MEPKLTDFGWAIRGVIWAETGKASMPTIEERIAELESEIGKLVRAELFKCYVLVDKSDDV